MNRIDICAQVHVHNLHRYPIACVVNAVSIETFTVSAQCSLVTAIVFDKVCSRVWCDT